MGPKSNVLPRGQRFRPLLCNCPSTTHGEERENRFFRVTHPFHPLRNCKFELIEYRVAWGEDRVYFLNSFGQLQRLPASWTDVGGEDPFAAVAAGRSPLRVRELVRLADLILRLSRSDV